MIALLVVLVTLRPTTMVLVLAGTVYAPTGAAVVPVFCCSFLVNVFAIFYPNAIDNAIHKDNTDYIANFDGYWIVIVPIIDAGTRIDMWADDKKTKIDECEYEMGDVVMLANQTHWHSVENKTIDKMSLHFFVDKPL